jgi:uncharacterized membrane protein YjfL (UPF0719 family)
MSDILAESLAGALYGLVGIAVLALGYLMVDLVTPGKLGKLIWQDRNQGAAITLSAALLGAGAIVTVAILSSEFPLVDGLVSSAAYGIVGLLIMTLAFGLLGLITPGKLGATVLEDKDGRAHPAAWALASAYIATSAVVAAAIS